jgi:flagellar protein FlaI
MDDGGVRETVVADLRERADAGGFDVPGGGVPDAEALERFLAFGDVSRAERGYWVNEPFAYVAIVYDTDDDSRHYRVLEPTLDEFGRYVRQDLAAAIRESLLDADFGDDAAFREALRGEFAEHAGTLSPALRAKLGYYFERDFLGYGAIDPFMRDPAVEDLSCDGSDVPAFVYHADYGNVRTNRRWAEDRLADIATGLAQRADRHLSASRPLLTTTLPDGSRVQVTLGGDVAARGSNFTIRKFREEPFTPPELVKYGTFSAREMAYLWLAVEYNRSVVFAGPTASGKTTSMNAACLFIPPDHKVVSIEETREVNLPHENWVADVTRESDLGEERPEVGTYELLSEALHQRPDHILVGEIRTNPDVVLTFFQAVGTGHEGFTTFHADTADDALRRLTHNPLNVPPELLADLDVISVQRLYRDDGGSVRRARSINEVGEPDAGDDRPPLREVFAYDTAESEFEHTGDSRVLRDIAAENGWTDERLRREFRRRHRVLAHLAETGRTGYEEVTDVFFRFSRNPEAVLESIPERDPEPLGLDG